MALTLSFNFCTENLIRLKQLQTSFALSHGSQLSSSQVLNWKFSNVVISKDEDALNWIFQQFWEALSSYMSCHNEKLNDFHGEKRKEMELWRKETAMKKSS